MCGPSNQESSIAGQTSSLGSTMAANYNQNFAAQAGVLQNLNNMLTPIAEAGPDQQGFGANELAALNTQASQGVGQNYSKAQQALNTTLATRGGGNEALPTGAQAALRGSLAASAANAQSNASLGITAANYNQGRANYNQATAGLNQLAQEYNPTGAGNLASGTLGSAFQQADTISTEKGQEQADIAGGIAGLAMSGATMGLTAGNVGGFGKP
jgi:hypothetical protein